MKSSRFAVGLVGLSLVGLWYFAGGTDPLPSTRAADAPPRVAAPLAHENLSVYLVFGTDAVPDAKVMSLQEALDRDLATVHETGNVNVLAIENRSGDHELFVQSGDIVKGGKQDRMVQSDMLIPPGSGVVPMPAHCVEQGRWTGRGAEDSKRFASSAKSAVGNELKLANYAGQQSAVWDNVKKNQSKLNDNLKATVNAGASPTSFQLTLESAALVAKVAEYEAALKGAVEDRGNVVGVVIAVNGQITGAEVYGSNALFRKAWPKLLNAAAVEAVADRTDAPTAAAPSAREVERFLAFGADAEPAGPGAEGFRTEGPAGEDELVRVRREAFALNALNDAEPAPRLARDQQNVAAVTRTATVSNPVTGRGAANANPSRLSVRGLGTSNVTDNIAARGNAAAQPAGADGNRLNSNRAENRSTLVVESRDPARANAVIHRSYVKK